MQLEIQKNENFEYKKCQYLTNFSYNIPFWFKVVIVEDYIEFSWTKQKVEKVYLEYSESIILWW